MPLSDGIWGWHTHSQTHTHILTIQPAQSLICIRQHINGCIDVFPVPCFSEWPCLYRQNFCRTEPFEVCFASVHLYTICIIWKLFARVFLMHAVWLCIHACRWVWHHLWTRLYGWVVIIWNPHLNCVRACVFSIIYFKCNTRQSYASLWKIFWINTYKRIWETLVKKMAVFFSFFSCNSQRTHTLFFHSFPSSLHCSSSTLLPAGTLTWSLNLLCFPVLWILVHSACEWRGNELILPASARGMVMLQTTRWGKCNEEAQGFFFCGGGGGPLRSGLASPSQPIKHDVI